MMRTSLIITALLLPGAAYSNGPAPAQSYSLRNLRPMGITVQTTGAERRQLLQFQNEQGNQFLLVEENTAALPVREVTGITPFLASSVHTCSIDLECKTKAFCTNDCKSLYYEVSNASPDKVPAGKNFCAIKAFSCTREGAVAAAMPSAPAPAAVVPAAMPDPARAPASAVPAAPAAHPPAPAAAPAAAPATAPKGP